MTRTLWLMLAIAVAIVMAKAIVTVEESLLIAIVIITIGSIDYTGSSNATKRFANWLVLTGVVAMFFSLFGSALPGSAFPLCYVILILLGMVMFLTVIILLTESTPKKNEEWTLDNKGITGKLS